MKLPTTNEEWTRFLSENNAMLVGSPAGPTIRLPRNNTIPFGIAPSLRQNVAKSLVGHFGTIEAVNRKIIKKQ